jgi:hypothetical protein
LGSRTKAEAKAKMAESERIDLKNCMMMVLICLPVFGDEDDDGESLS